MYGIPALTPVYGKPKTTSEAHAPTNNVEATSRESKEYSNEEGTCLEGT